MSKLRAAYLQLVGQARRLHGQTRRRKLRNGAQISVVHRNGVQMVSFSRQDKPLGEIELLTFKEHCEIPEHAQRLPIEGQSNTEARRIDLVCRGVLLVDRRNRATYNLDRDA